MSTRSTAANSRRSARRSNEDHRRPMARAADRGAARAGHPPDRRPRPRDAVLDARQPPRHLSRSCASPICSPAAARSASKRCRAAPRRRPSSKTTRQRPRSSSAMRRSSARPIQIACAARRWPCRAPSPFDLILADPPYAPGSGSAVVAAVLNAGWLAPGGWMSVETSRGDAIDAGELDVDSDTRRRPRPAYAFAPPLACLRGFPDFVDFIAEPAADGGGGRFPGFLHCLARALTARCRSPLVKPCSASEASAAVAATATSSATSGLCSSLINASPILASDREPPPPLEDATRATAVPVFLFLLLPAFAPLFGVAFLAIVIAPGLSPLDA